MIYSLWLVLSNQSKYSIIPICRQSILNKKISHLGAHEKHPSFCKILTIPAS